MFRFFENLIDPYADYDESDAPPRGLVPFMVSWSRPFYKLFAVLIFFSLLIAGIELWLIGYLGRLVDLVAQSTPEVFWNTHSREIMLVAIFILIGRPIIQLIDLAFMNNGLMPNYGTLYRWRAHKQVLRQSIAWFENDFAGRIANRVMQTPPAAGDAIFQVFDAITFSVAYMVGAAVLLARADYRLAIPLILWFILYALLTVWVLRRVGPASRASSDARSMTTGRVVDSYTNIHSVKLFAHHDFELSYAKEAVEKTRQTFAREMRIYTKMDFALTAVNGLLIVGVVGYALWLWSLGLASVGIVAVATALTLRLNAMTGWIMWALSSFFQALGVVREGMETITDPIGLLDAKDAKPLLLREGKIAITDLSHHYGEKTQTLSGGLSNINIVISPREKIGIVGRSGAGKSTLVKLLMRFYDPDEGEICIDGQSIRSVTQNSLRSCVGMVSQENALLHRSVRDNILYGRPSASLDEVMKAAKQARAHDFILGLEDPDGRQGYDAHVGERGVRLSGGQRQRISLARVILKDAPILILDEATSALDSEVESLIQASLIDVMQSKTVIAIAHRLSTIAAMDRLIVLDEGRIIEEGTHQDLLEQKGLYEKLWRHQSGGFLDLSSA